MTGDLITHRLLQGIAVILFGIALELAGGGVMGLVVAVIGLIIAAVVPSTGPRGPR
ncbi:MAG TPA: hypothetical protein VJ850_09340 [Candidatus Limnocylindrales bacterium]|nr:hypothetical protein [Candidatus Limnocylindrales bacterium]